MANKSFKLPIGGSKSMAVPFPLGGGGATGAGMPMPLGIPRTARPKPALSMPAGMAPTASTGKRNKGCIY